ncbi:MAG: sulfotransferase family protein [Solirubrobacterales bacterium]
MEASTTPKTKDGAGPPATAGAPAAVNGARRGGALPNLVVIGAQKCGTSGLHYHLGLHPQISMSKPKELNFFIEERNWGRGLEWYREHFDEAATVRGEASPNYTAYPHHLGVPERMHSLIPEAKLIYVVRDPLVRIASHWVHNYAKRREKGDLAATLSHPNTSYLVRSQYHMQLQQFLRFYDMEQVLVFQQSDFRRERADSLRSIFEFLGVDPDFTHPSFERERHATARKTRATRLAARLERMSKTRRGRLLPPKVWFALDERLPLRRPIERPDVRDALDDEALRVLREDAERLRELVGRDFAAWSIFET